MNSSADRFLTAFAAELLELELGPIGHDRRNEAVEWVHRRVRGASAPVRISLTAASLLLATAVTLSSGRPFDRLPANRRRRITRRLARTRAPIAAEYVRSVRLLAVPHVYGARRTDMS